MFVLNQFLIHGKPHSWTICRGVHLTIVNSYKIFFYLGTDHFNDLQLKYIITKLLFYRSSH